MSRPGSGLVLASSSPRRRDMLERLGLEIEVVAPDVEELRGDGESPAAFALRVARDKARSVADLLGRTRHVAPFVIGADTVVVVDDEPLGKPSGTDEARRMIGRLSGRHHVVITGWCVLRRGAEERCGVEETVVRFRPLRQAEVDAYAASGEGLDKAGAYGIQGLGCLLVERIEGSYENVVGLPISRIFDALLDLGAIAGIPERRPAP